MINDLNTPESLKSVKFGTRTVNTREALTVIFPDARHSEEDRPLYFVVIPDECDPFGKSAFLAGTTKADFIEIENDGIGDSFQGNYGAPILRYDEDSVLEVYIEDWTARKNRDLDLTDRPYSERESMVEALRDSGIDANWFDNTGRNVESVVRDRLNENRESDPILKGFLDRYSSFL